MNLEKVGATNTSDIVYALRRFFRTNRFFYALRRELTWTQIRTLSYIEDALKRQFYIEMCKLEKWSSRTLNDKINGMLYERTALSKKPEKLIKKELEQLNSTGYLSPDLVFRNTYFLDFLGLKDTFSEKDLENAILQEMQYFIQELGGDFAFMARQKRLTIDSIDYYLDLLFYHRSLRRLVAIDLKLGKFKPEYEGQMLLYLRWLQKYEMKPEEESPIGLILCSEGNTEHIELLMLEDGNIRVAQYFTELPDKKLLAK